MVDGLGREIRYLRLSVTDRCNLRCAYCMPEAGVETLGHGDILRYEEILRLAGIFAGLGVCKLRLTGGEPLVRKGLPALVAGLKALVGIETLCMTTNGLDLKRQLPDLLAAGLDSVNLSLDALEEEAFRKITRRPGLNRVLEGLEAALASPGLEVKLNCVPLEQNADQLVPLARFAAARGVPLRFIERMPLGPGAAVRGLPEAEIRRILEAELGPLQPEKTEEPGEKCRYFRGENGGRLGFISPLSRPFCAGCDRIRLTADGFLKTCLQQARGVDLKALLDRDDEEIRAAIRTALAEKPVGHRFGQMPAEGDEKRNMVQIGG